MSKYLDKQKLLKWLEQRFKDNSEEFEIDRYGEDLEIIDEIKSGRFDMDGNEVQNLRSALVKIKQLLDENRENDGAFQSWGHMQAWKIATQALSATIDNTREKSEQKNGGINSSTGPNGLKWKETRTMSKGGYPTMRKEVVEKLKELRSKHLLDDPEVRLAVLKRKGVTLPDRGIDVDELEILIGYINLFSDYLQEITDLVWKIYRKVRLLPEDELKKLIADLKDDR